MHSTNKVFDRYLQVQNEDAARVYRMAHDTENGTPPAHQKLPAKIHTLQK